MTGPSRTPAFGAIRTQAGVVFTLWAPDARSVELVLESGDAFPMQRDEDGLFRQLLSDAGAGTRYRYRIDGSLEVPDPASRFQPRGIEGPSEVVDASRYEWRAADWKGRCWREAVIWECHVGTATSEGTYAALADKLDDLRDLGITAIEIMPVAEFEGTRNWGYDGVLPFAPTHDYGTPDDLRAFIDAAHARGIMVVLDVVYNHFGPSGNYLHAYAKRFFNEAHRTPWGGAINFDAPGREMVRAFFVQNALTWLTDFRLDGLRFDAVHAFVDDSEPHFLDELASEIRSAPALANREIHLILENERNEARWLERDAPGCPRLYTAQWNDDFHHCWHCLLTGEHESYYADFADRPLEKLGRSLTEGFVYQGEESIHQKGKRRGEISKDLPPTAFVSFLQNHDQIGNRALGERLSALTSPERLAVAQACFLLAPQIPMLFMGEEWDASAPFQFFVDFSQDADLSRAVREGRRSEFAHFSAFSDPQKALSIPDPTEATTFMRSRLDWREAARDTHARKRAFIRELIALRRREIVPLLDGPRPTNDWRVSDDVLEVEWRFAKETLRLVLNTSDDARSRACAEASRAIWQSVGVNIGRGEVHLPSWSALVSKEATA